MDERYLLGRIQILEQALADLQSRVSYTARWATTTGDVNYSSLCPTVQVQHTDSDTHDIYMPQQYGIYSSPLPGCDLTTLSFWGSNNHTVAIASNDQRYMPSGQNGGDITIQDWKGQNISVRGGKTIVINPQSTLSVVVGSATLTISEGTLNIYAPNGTTITTPTVHLTGDLQVDGTITANTDVVTNGINLKTHHHNFGSSPTSGPIG